MENSSSENVQPSQRMLYGFLDSLFFVFAWYQAQVMTSKFLPISVMQRYKQSDFDAYLEVMFWMTVVLFINSVLMHKFFGASIGKLFCRCRTVMTDGSRMTWSAAIWRALIMFLIGLSILAPGPLIAFIFGPGSEAASIVALTLGIGFWLFWVLLPEYHPNGNALPSRLERICGVRTIKTLSNQKQ